MQMGHFSRISLWFIVLLLLLATSGAQTAVKEKGETDALAVVNGQNITDDDLVPYIQGQMFPLHQQEYDIKNSALDGLINLRLLEGEAKKKGISTDQLIEQEVDSKVADPTDAEVYAIYVYQRQQLDKPFEELKAPLQKFLKQAKAQEAREKYYKQLRQQATISILLPKPKVEVAADAARLRGNSNAPVTIVEFSDFQCPYCRAVEPTLKKVLAKYEGQVNLAYHDLPLRDIHPQAQLAAEAGRCAGEQGKFWEYHDLLLENQNKLAREDLVGYARTLKLDDKQLDSCLSFGRYRPLIEQERQLGLKAGLTGTPGFLINGKLLSGNLPQDSFEKFIQEALAALPKQQAAAR
jgi:protein-disulfide isomerase